MLVVRKEGKAHDQYNSFRSAFELLEAVGREPKDTFQETADDLPPLQKLEKKVAAQNEALRRELDKVKAEAKAERAAMQQQIDSMSLLIQELRLHKDVNSLVSWRVTHHNLGCVPAGGLGMIYAGLPYTHDLLLLG